MSSSLQLIPAYFDSKPVDWRREYVKNMRQVRGYPTYWCIRDDEAYIDGPPSEGAFYTKEHFAWKVEIVKDAQGNNSSEIALYNLDEFLDTTKTSEAGDTVYSYQQTHAGPVLTYEHTEVVDSVSLEFDQNGRRIIAFEAGGEVYLIWYDSQAQRVVTTAIGAGRTPQIVTTTYRRTGGAGDSERLLFYVDGNTQQIVYRRQLDRYGSVYNLPVVSGGVVELLKVSKNLYGGLTAVYATEVSAGVLQTGSFTARDFAGGVNLGTDGTPIDVAVPVAYAGIPVAFNLRPALVTFTSTSTVGISASSGTVLGFKVVSKIIERSAVPDTTQFLASAGTVPVFEIKSVQRLLTAPTEQGTQLPNLGAVPTFNINLTLIEMLDNPETIQITSTTGSVNTFTIG